MLRANVVALVVVIAVGGSVRAMAAEPGSPAGSRVVIHAGGFAAYAPTASGTAFGVGAVAEPKYQLIGGLSVGARVELALMLGFDTTSGGALGSNLVLSSGIDGAVVPKVEYQFTLGENFKPFIGLGAGLYLLGRLDNGAGLFVAGGVAPQLGVDLGALRIGLTYHNVFRAADTLGPSYLTLEVSGRL